MTKLLTRFSFESDSQVNKVFNLFFCLSHTKFRDFCLENESDISDIFVKKIRFNFMTSCFLEKFYFQNYNWYIFIHFPLPHMLRKGRKRELLNKFGKTSFLVSICCFLNFGKEKRAVSINCLSQKWIPFSLAAIFFTFSDLLDKLGTNNVYPKQSFGNESSTIFEWIPEVIPSWFLAK